MALARTGFATPPSDNVARFPCLAFGYRADNLADGQVFVRFNGVNHAFDGYAELRDAVLEDTVGPGEVLVRRGGHTLHFGSDRAFRAAAREADRQDRATLDRRRARRLRRIAFRRVLRALERLTIITLLALACWGFVVATAAMLATDGR